MRARGFPALHFPAARREAGPSGRRVRPLPAPGILERACARRLTRGASVFLFSFFMRDVLIPAGFSPECPFSPYFDRARRF